jgi:hypothetical protein
MDARFTEFLRDDCLDDGGITMYLVAAPATFYWAGALKHSKNRTLRCTRGLHDQALGLDGWASDLQTAHPPTHRYTAPAIGCQQPAANDAAGVVDVRWSVTGPSSNRPALSSMRTTRLVLASALPANCSVRVALWLVRLGSPLTTAVLSSTPCTVVLWVAETLHAPA